mgnify:CR=1 FL=1
MAKHTDTSHVAASARRARARNMRLIKACIVVIVVSVAFVAGFTARGDASLLESLGFTSLVVDVDRNPGSTTSGDTYDSLGARVEEVEGLIDLAQPVADAVLKPGFPFALGSSFIMPRG